MFTELTNQNKTIKDIRTLKSLILQMDSHVSIINQSISTVGKELLLLDDKNKLDKEDYEFKTLELEQLKKELEEEIKKR